MLSTTYQQVFHILSILWLPVAIVGYFALRNKILRDFPGRSTIETMRIEVAEFQGLVGDLNDRFSRFQKREGMREARSAKQTEAEVLAQAREIAAQASVEEPGNDKTALYRRARRIQ